MSIAKSSACLLSDCGHSLQTITTDPNALLQWQLEVVNANIKETWVKIK